MPTLLAKAANPEIADFYKTVAAMSFTLLGLWWIAVQLKYKGGAGDPLERRYAYSVMLYFLLPGVMTTLSAVNAELGLLWRLAFGVTGAFGLIEVLLYAAGYQARSRGATALHACALVVYLLIIAVAFRPTLAMDLGIGLQGQEVESILVGLLIVVGANLAWFGIAGPRREESEA